MRNVLKQIVNLDGSIFLKHQESLFGAVPMKLAALSYMKSALMDQGIFLPTIHHGRHLGIITAPPSWKVIPAMQRIAKSHSCRYSATNRVVLTLHGLQTSQLLFAGEGQAVKAGGKKMDVYHPPLTPVCGASTIIDSEERVHFSRYLCWKSFVGTAEQFIEPGCSLEGDLVALQTIYQKHLGSLGTSQSLDPKCFLDNITGYAMSLRYPKMSQALDIDHIEQVLGPAPNKILSILRHFLLTVYGVWNNGRELNLLEDSTVAFCHIFVECGVFLLCHKLTLGYTANPRASIVIDVYLDDTEQDRPQDKTSTMYNALGTASRCLEIMENRSDRFLQCIHDHIAPHIQTKCSLIVQSFLPTFR